MYRIFFILFFITSFLPTSNGQLGIGGTFSFDWNLYSWYQRPVTISTQYRSAGQAVNVVPGVNAGVLIRMGKAKAPVLLSATAGVNYMPFAFDLKNFNGMGAVSFPVMGTFYIPLNKIYPYSFISLGAGMQWMDTELYFRPEGGLPHNGIFRAYAAEIGFGRGFMDYNSVVDGWLFFTRIGIGEDWDYTNTFSLDVGFRFYVGIVTKKREDLRNFDPQKFLNSL